MSKDGKKPGARDISDLKARLGLKKGEGGARGGGVAPPGAAKIGAFVPPPPGVAPPPGQPQVPDVKNDPFGAMNAIAAQNAVTRAPEVIVVDHTVQKVEEGSKAARYGKVAAIILAPLIVGFVLGGINYERRRYNNNLVDAKLLFEEFHQIGKSIDELEITLLNAGKTPDGRYKLYDQDLVDSLEKLNFTLADDDKLILFHRNLYALEPKMVQDTLTFYQRMRTLTAKVKEHIRLTKLMKDRMNDATKSAVGTDTPLAVVVKPLTQQEVQAGKRPHAGLVAIGQTACANGQPGDKCPEGPPSQLMYREDPGSPWVAKPLAAASDTTDKLILLDSNGVFTAALQKGPKDFLDEALYYQRLIEIETLVHGSDGQSGLKRDRKDLEDQMNNVAQKKKVLAL